MWDVRPWLVGAELIAHVLGESDREPLANLVTPRSLPTWRDGDGVDQLRRLVDGAMLSQFIRPHSERLVELRIVQLGSDGSSPRPADTPFVVGRLFVEYDEDMGDWRVHQADTARGTQG